MYAKYHITMCGELRQEELLSPNLQAERVQRDKQPQDICWQAASGIIKRLTILGDNLLVTSWFNGQARIKYFAYRHAVAASQSFLASQMLLLNGPCCVLPTVDIPISGYICTGT